ncbi:MFS transporter [Brevibacterium sp. CFH 10365]|uniref:MFS transporter n=1 Tax=Brevibacterium sp. CFH 10365 TaxID=2585207 RepID=UPI00126642EC|nr:MFS transporter [Brevibacterium sp. CFH 10365]
MPLNSTAKPITHRDPEKPGRIEKIGYGMAGGANNVVWTGISTFLVYFYTDIVGIAAGLIGTIFLFSRIIDGASDVVMGVVLDKTRTRFGKARPWLLWLALPFAVVATALFAVPDASTTTQIIYIIVTYNIALLVYTAVEIPHGTLGALMTYDQHQRSVLNVAKMIGAYVAIIAITNITLPIVDFFGGGQSGWVYTFVLFGLVAAATYFFTFWSTKERTDPVGTKQNAVKPTVKASLISLVRNKYWFIATLVLLLMYIYNAITAGVAIYYSEYVLGSPALVGVVATALTLATLGGMLLVVPITRRFGKRNTAIVGCLIAIVGSLIIFAVPDSTAVVVIGQVVRGIGKAAIMGVIFAMLADTMEYGEWKTGIRIEGLIYSGASMGIKVGTGLGSALIGWGLAASGYLGGQETQSAEAVSMISNLFIWVPTLVSVLMAVLLYFFKLDKQYPQILEELRVMKERQA